MRKVYAILISLLCVASMAAQQPNVARTKEVKKLPANAAAFTFSDIKNWTGEGSNSAALAIKWTGSENTLVFGYHFDGEKTGEQMILDVAANNPRFYILEQTGTTYGSAIGGFGWDVNTDDTPFTLVDSKGNVATADENGVYVLTSGYSFDDYSAGNTADYWNSGWYKGYWSYWVASDSPKNAGYSGVGATGRKLADGCWDLWMFSSFSGGTNDWGPLVSAPSNQTSTEVSDVEAVKTVAGVKYVNLAGQTSNEAFSGVNIVVTTYTDGTTSAVKVIK